MKQMLDNLRPLGDDGVPTYGVLPAKLKKPEEDEALEPCNCLLGLVIGTIIGLLFWGVAILSWWLATV